MLPKITDFLITLAYPQACHSCEKSVEHLADGVACGVCWEKTRVFSGRETLCHKCGAFHSGEATDFRTFCHRCDGHFYDRAAAVGLYERALAASVLNLKREPFVAKRLRDKFLRRWQHSGFRSADLIIPVPLSKKRRLERGFNQAEVLAEIIAGQTGLKLDRQSLSRRLHTPVHRAGMDGKARAMTVKNAFEVNRRKLFEGKTILLIDDVYTSGATVSGCAEVLKKAGAGRVFVLTLAHTDFSS